MKVSEHSAPVNPGEDILEHPKADDPRVKPWLAHLVELGVMKADGTCLKKAKLMRGIDHRGYLWRIEWQD